MFGVQVLEVQVWYICWGLVLKVWGLNELNETPNCLNEPKTPNPKPKNPKPGSVCRIACFFKTSGTARRGVLVLHGLSASDSELSKHQVCKTPNSQGKRT